MSSFPLIGGVPTASDSEVDRDKVRPLLERLHKTAADLGSIAVSEIDFATHRGLIAQLRDVTSDLVPAPEVDLAKLCEQIGRIRDELGGLVSPPASGALPLASVAIELGITATGDVGFIVTKASVELSGKITVTFERPK